MRATVLREAGTIAYWGDRWKKNEGCLGKMDVMDVMDEMDLMGTRGGYDRGSRRGQCLRKPGAPPSPLARDDLGRQPRPGQGPRHVAAERRSGLRLRKAPGAFAARLAPPAGRRGGAERAARPEPVAPKVERRAFASLGAGSAIMNGNWFGRVLFEVCSYYAHQN